MAYYAQLRGALSILANLGVGVFDGINLIVDRSGAIVRIDPSRKPTRRGLGTHTIVWQALDSWVAEPAAAKQFLDLIKFQGESLSDCIEAIWPGTSIATVAREAILSWGLDLKRGGDDRQSRNVSSYMPTALNPIPCKAADVFQFVSSVWQLFEPRSSYGFDGIDRFLLRQMLWGRHRIVEKNNKYESGAIADNYSNLSPTVQSAASLEFLIGKSESHHPLLLREAKSSASPAGALQMLSRSFIMVRVATAFTHSSFSEAGVRCSAGALRPWLDPWAIDRGLWSPDAPPSDPLDLWADIDEALNEVESLPNPGPANLNDWISRVGRVLPSLCQAERVAVWGLSA